MVYEISSGCLYYRMKEKCMTHEMAVSYPSNRDTKEARLIRESGISARTIRSRMKRLGLSLEDAIAFRPEHQYKYGVSINAVAKKHGIPSGTLHTRIKAGMSLEDAINFKFVHKYKHGISVEEAAAKHGMIAQTLYSRLAKGMSLEDAVTAPLCSRGRRRK